MNDRQFCFILCVSDDLYKEECLTYLNALEIPEGYSTDVLTIEGAESMCAGYNAGMQASDAKYKIYLHQDVFIREPQFLQKLLDIFQNPKIGMIGMVGTEKLSEDAVMWNGARVGNLPGVEEMVRNNELSDFEVLQEGIREVEAVDGMLIVTQADLPWREDLFDGWDFYDVSQSMEFRKAGYQVVVPAQRPEAWVQHDAVTLGLGNYEKYRSVFLQEYRKQFMTGGRKPRILYPLTRRIRTWDIPYALKLQGREPLLADMNCDEISDAEGDVNRLSREIRELHADAVMTHDFYPFAARACDENGIPYIAWIWDSLQAALYDESVRLPGNYLYDFDRLQAAETKQRGAVHVLHQPLAANPHRLDQLEISDEDKERYSCDIAFIGTLYSGYDGYRLPEEKLRPETIAEAERLLTSIVGCWDGSDRITDRLSDATVADIAAALPEDTRERRLIGDRRYVEQTAIARRAAYLERTEMLRRLTGFGVRLYTWKAEQDIRIPDIEIRGELDYQTEMPKAYRLSRININTTLPSIRTGVPLRVFEIMAAGGFVLSNYQAELEDYFDIGEDLEVYRSFEELTDKAEYYLRHEEKRRRIAERGWKKVKTRYSYERRVDEILADVSADLKRKGKAVCL